MSKDVWILAEYNNHQLETVTCEMLSEGRKLANSLNKRLCACLIGYRVEEYIHSLAHWGADKVYLVENELLAEYSLDAYVFVLVKLIEEHGPSIMMIGATPLGSELAPRIAARLKLPCITEVKKTAVNGQNLVIAKSGYTDKVYLSFDFVPKRTVVLTSLPGDMEPEETNECRQIEIIREDIHIKGDMIRTRNMGFIKGDPKEISLDEAELIVAVGKGTGSESLAVVEAFADMLGASIGGTRPIVDDGIIPFERQIGITGKSVAPKLLIACGISGAREFTAGIEHAKLVVAINIDQKARILKSADLGVLGDLHRIIPLIIHEIERRKQNLQEESGS